MTYEIYRYIFIGGAIAAGVMLAVSVVLFFVLDIPAVIGDLTGRTERKAIEDIRKRNEAGGNRAHRSSSVNLRRGKLTDKISGSGRIEHPISNQLGGHGSGKMSRGKSQRMNTQGLKGKTGSMTGRIQNAPTGRGNTQGPLTAFLPENNMTTVLPDNNATTVLPENNATTVLSESDATTVLPENNPAPAVPESDATTVLPENNPVPAVPESDATTILPENNPAPAVPESDATTILPENNVTTVLPANEPPVQQVQPPEPVRPAPQVRSSVHQFRSVAPQAPETSVLPGNSETTVLYAGNNTTVLYAPEKSVVTSGTAFSVEKEITLIHSNEEIRMEGYHGA